MSRVGVSQGWKLKVNPLSLTEFLKRRVKVHCEKNSTVLSLTYSQHFSLNHNRSAFNTVCVPGGYLVCFFCASERKRYNRRNTDQRSKQKTIGKGVGDKAVAPTLHS